MSSRVNGVNRAVLILLGLILVSAGVLGLTLGLGAFGDARASDPVLSPRVRSFSADYPWFWWAVAGACLLVALLGFWWLLAQLRVERVSRLDVTTDDRQGLTTVHSGAVSDAVEDEVRSIRGVGDVSAHFRGSGTQRLSLTVDLAEYADIAEVRRTIETQTVLHVRQALDDPTLPVEVQLRPGSSRTPQRSLA